MTDTLNYGQQPTLDIGPTSLSQGARMGMTLGMDSSPDFEAELRKASQATGVPLAAARTFPDDVKRRAQIESTDFDGMAQQYPNTAKLLSNVDNARIAHDDTKSLFSMETVFGALGGVAQYVTSAPGQETGLLRDVAATGIKVPQYIATAQRATFDTMGYFLNPYIDLVSKEKNPIRYFADEGGKAASYYSKLATETSSQWDKNSIPAQIFGGGATSGVQSMVQNMGTGVAASYLLGPQVGIPVTLAMMAGTSGLEAYQKAREKGLGVPQSLAYGAQDATAEFVTEKYLGMAGFLEKAMAGAGAKKLFMYEITKEIPGEIGATVWQKFNEWMNINPEKPMSKFMEELPVDIAQTVVATIVGGGGQIGIVKALESAGSSLIEHQQKVQSAEQQKMLFEQIDTLVTESKLKARDMDVFSQFVQANTDGTPIEDVYIAASALNQSGVVDQLVQAVPSVREQLEDAMASDGFVRIPMSEYMSAIAGTPLNQSIIENVKLDPNGYTFAESNQYNESFNAEMGVKLEQMMAEKQDDTTFKASRDAVKDTFLAQLNQSKRFTPDANEAYATLLANFYSVTAAKLGVTPEALVQKYQLNVVSNMQNGAQFDQSASIRSGQETLEKYGLEPGKQYNTRDIAKALEARQLEKYGHIARDDRGPKAISDIAEWIAEEVKFEMENPANSGVGWYSEKFQNALNIMGDTFPELKTDQSARDVMTALIAITSDGQKVMGNTNQAMDIYSNFRETGKFTTNLGHQRQDSIDGNLAVLQDLHDRLGADGMRDFLMQEKTISELKQIAKANGTELKSDYQAMIKMPMAVVSLGPKLGAFYANLMGAHGYLTMDRWWSRTFNRYRGGLLTKPTDTSLRSFAELLGKPRMSDEKVLEAIIKPQAALENRGFKTRLAVLVGKSEPSKDKDKPKWFAKAQELAGKDYEKLLKEHNIERAANTIYKAAFVNLEDAPFGAKDRTFMLDATNAAQQKLAAEGYNLSIADIQAILWYYEKKLYGELGARSSGKISYEDAARIVVDARNRGLDISGLESANEDEDSESAGGSVPLGQEQYQAPLNQLKPTFFSQLNKAVAEAKQTKAPASDWLSIISKLSGVKAEEIEWTGLKDYLNLLGKEQVTKEQLMGFLAQNGVQVQEVMKGEQGAAQARKFAAADMQETMEAGGTFDDDAEYALNNWLNSDPDSRLANQAVALLEEKLIEAGDDRTVDEYLEAGGEFANNTKYGDYVLPGGTNYRELLLTLPVQMTAKETERMMSLEAQRSRMSQGAQFVFDDDERGQELAQLKAKSKANVYNSNHWAEENILAHIRINDRVDADGKRVLFIEEVQSDWAQDGRKKGFKEDFASEEEMLKKRDELYDARTELVREALAIEKEKGVAPQELLDRIEAINNELRTVEETKDKARIAIPSAPYVTDTKGWLNLALKRITMMAVAGGYDKVAFVNGQQSADRYKLSKAVNDISWTDKPDGGRMVMLAMAENTPVQLTIDNKGIVTKAKNLAQGQGKPLDEIVGKDLAMKIMTEKGGDLEGVDMDIGGEGMKAFYDKIVPQAVGSLIKKLGGNKLESVRIRQDVTSEVNGEEYTQNINSEQVGFEVTDQMREEVMKGQPLFQNTGGEQSRGQIFFGQDITTQPSVIALLDNADLSTFIHETGHFFLQVQADLAMRIQGQISAGASVSDEERGIVDDMNKTLSWMGIEADMTGSALDRWAQMSLEEQRPYHEMWARGFEAYAFEGNAPTMEMQQMFQKFRSWLVAVYRTIKDALIGDVLQVKLTDEVRSVMDRMLATADQIKAAEDARNMGPLFNTTNAADIIEDWRAYHELANATTNEAIDELNKRKLKDLQWLSNAREGMLKMLQKQHDELRQDVRREVIREVMSQQVYQVWQFLTNKQGEEFVPGVTEGTGIVLAHFSGKLRTDVLRDMYGTKEDAVWRKLSGLRMTSDTNGMHPDILAEIAGYGSADAMIQALANALPPSQIVDAMTDQRMLERHGDLATPEAMQKAADIAVHSQMRAKMLHAEARALERAMEVREKTGKTDKGGRPTSYAVLPKAAKAFAERMISRLKVRDIKPSQYAAAEAKAAKAAERAFGKGDLEEAAAQKRNQIINNYSTREAYRIQEEVRKAVAYLRKFDKKSKGLDADYYDQIVQMLERFDLVPSTSLKEIDKRTALTEWLLAKQEEGIMPEIPPIFEKDFRTSFKNMTVEQLLGLRDTIKQLDHLGRLKQKLMNAKDQRDFVVIRDEMIASIEANSRGRTADNVTPSTVLGEAMVKVKEFGAQHIKVATLARIMDGGIDGGPVWEHLIRTANLSNNQEVKMREAATRELSALIAPVLAQGDMKDKPKYFEGVPTSQDKKNGKTGSSFTKEARLAMALNMGNASNMQRLLGGEGWTLQQIKPILDTLTEADWNFVQAVWDYFETYRPLIAEKERRVYGVEPKWIDAQTLNVQTADGKTLSLRGGYYPVKFDSRRTQIASQHKQAEEAKRMMQGAYTSATTRRSFTKGRVEEVNGMPLMYTIDGLYNGINEVIHDLCWHEWLIDTNRLVKDEGISEVIRDTYGAESHDQIKRWIQDIADGGRSAAQAGEQFYAWMRQGVSIAGIGMNIMSALIQPVGITNSWVRIGGKYVGIGIQKALADPLGSYRDVCDKSDFMRARGLTTMRELAELRNQVKGQSQLRRGIDSAAYALMLRAQQLVDVPTWIGAYEKAVAEGHADDKSIDMADQAVIDAQGDGTINNQSAVERGGPGMKALTVFYSFQNALLNLAVGQTMTKKDNAKLTADYLMLFVVPVILTSLMKAAFTPGDSGDWDDPEKIAKKLFKEGISQLMSLFIGVREFAGLYDAVSGEPGGDYQGPSGLRPIADTMKLAKQIGQWELDDQLRKSIVNLAGDLFRLPSAQINRTITGTKAYLEDKTDNPAAIIFGYQEPR